VAWVRTRMKDSAGSTRGQLVEGTVSDRVAKFVEAGKDSARFEAHSEPFETQGKKEQSAKSGCGLRRSGGIALTGIALGNTVGAPLVGTVVGPRARATFPVTQLEIAILRTPRELLQVERRGTTFLLWCQGTGLGRAAASEFKEREQC
jgi:hypothetical protein